MFDQGLHAAERGGDLDQLQPGDGGERGVRAAFQFEREHAAKAALHLLASDRVLRVARKAGIGHALHGGMSFQALRKRHCVFARLAHAQMQRAHPAQQEPGLERTERGPADLPLLADIGPDRQVGVADRQRAGQHVGMTVEIFGRRMVHDVGAVLDGALQKGRRRRGIDSQQCAGVVRGVRCGGDVDHLVHRVDRRLDPDQPRLALTHET